MIRKVSIFKLIKREGREEMASEKYFAEISVSNVIHVSKRSKRLISIYIWDFELF
jgi:hypothetical protein